MIFQKQTKFSDPKTGSRGNCMMACYCSYLEIPIGRAPALEELFNCEEPIGFWDNVTEIWLNSRGYKRRFIPVLEDRITDPYHTSKFTNFYFASGKSPRGVNHQVIYLRGEMIFDPHPSNAGLLEVNEWIVLEPIGQIVDINLHTETHMDRITKSAQEFYKTLHRKFD